MTAPTMELPSLADLVVKYGLAAERPLQPDDIEFSSAAQREQFIEGQRLHELTLRQAVEAGQWDEVFSMLGHHGRGCALVLVGPRLPRRTLRRILRDFWNLTEGVRPGDAVELFRRAGFVRDTRNRLPGGALTIFRGVSSPRHRLGLSWTLDLDVARFFAQRYRSEPGPVYAAELDSTDALAYFASRDEAEVIVDPQTLRHIRRVRD